ncbi:MAG: energy-coupling factor transporter transmembrane protein EcfT [Desulfobacula sp.]|nr:energy-coupling factor transporter transmembrane protein EcfT [Desulfobacula sp.]
MALIPFAFRPGKSALHLLDARLKFFLICLVSTSMLSASFVPCLIYSLLLILFFNLARIKVFQLLISMKFFLLLLGFIFLARCFSTPGDTLISAYGISISRLGVTTGFLVAFKFLLVMMTGLLFSGTTRPAQVKGAVQWFLRPIPFLPEKRVAVMISLSLAFMPIILKQNQKVADAQAARCGNLEKNPVKKIIRMVLPLLKKIFLCADNIILAMESRCYTEDRTDPEFQPSGKEPSFLLGSLILAFVFIVL